MPTEARMRAERCRERAEECMRLSAMTDDPDAKTRYLEMAQQYLKVAEAEQSLAAQLERLIIISPDAG